MPVLPALDALLGQFRSERFPALRTRRPVIESGDMRVPVGMLHPDSGPRFGTTRYGYDLRDGAGRPCFESGQASGSGFDGSRQFQKVRNSDAAGFTVQAHVRRCIAPTDKFAIEVPSHVPMTLATQTAAWTLIEWNGDAVRQKLRREMPKPLFQIRHIQVHDRRTPWATGVRQEVVSVSKGGEVESWSRERDLNPQPPLYESGALPLSYPGAKWGTGPNYSSRPREVNRGRRAPAPDLSSSRWKDRSPG